MLSVAMVAGVAAAGPLSLATRHVSEMPRQSPCSLIVTTSDDSGSGSLRAAIECADSGSGPATITFAIGSGAQTISSLSPLPVLTQTTLIDGSTQPGFTGTPLIRVDGTAVTGTPGALVLSAGGCAVEGLEITGWAGAGLELEGSDENVTGSYIGSNGSTALANATGIYVPSGSGDMIGGSAADARNILSGNGDGLILMGSATTGNDIEGNWIGTDAAGTDALANTYGVLIGAGASSNRVEDNLISGNGQAGVNFFDTGTSTNSVEGNRIGTDAAGTAAVPNTYGVLIGEGANSNSVGGTNGAASNLISGNSAAGIEIIGTGTETNEVEGNQIGTDAAGSAALPNNYGILVGAGASSNILGGTTAADGNLISGDTVAGVEVFGAGSSENLVDGNRIGTNAAGTATLGHSEFGVEVLTGATRNTIGGSGAGAGNLVSGNGEGVIISGDGTSGNLVEGNYVGTDASGTAALPNDSGILVGAGASANTVGGTSVADRNLISGNSDAGVEIFGAGTTGNLLEGNRIGTDPAGAGAIGNKRYGVEVTNAADRNSIGGSVDGAGNLVSGNDEGVLISGDGTSGNLVEGNFVGTDAAGAAGLANVDGVLVGAGASSNTVGGTSTADRNLISGNSDAGVEIYGKGTSGNSVEGNRIGLALTASGSIANGTVGVLVTGDATNDTIGGTSSGSGNSIAHDTTGVEVVGPSSHDPIEQNSIFADSKGGIALVSAGNGDVAAPKITSAQTRGSTMTISGTVALGTQLIEVFANPDCPDAEGTVFLAAVTTANGRWSLRVLALVGGRSVTATTTSASNTSSFSGCEAVRAARRGEVLILSS
jgi:titin